MIKTVVKWQNGMVTVFDSRGEQIPIHQGKYENVKEDILKHAPPQARFFHGDWSLSSKNEVSREEW